MCSGMCGERSGHASQVSIVTPVLFVPDLQVRVKVTGSEWSIPLGPTGEWPSTTEQYRVQTEPLCHVGIAQLDDVKCFTFILDRTAEQLPEFTTVQGVFPVFVPV